MNNKRQTSLDRVEAVVFRLLALLAETKTKSVIIPRDLALDIQQLFHERKELSERMLGSTIMYAKSPPARTTISLLDEYLEKITWNIELKKHTSGSDNATKDCQAFEQFLKPPHKMVAIPRLELRHFTLILRNWLLYRRQYKV